MKPGIHPDYRDVVFQDVTSGFSFLTRSTLAAGSKDSVRFIGNALVRRLRNTTVADEITGSQITWDNTNELFTVQGGAATPANPGGRVRVVISPRPEDAASAAAAAPGPALKPSLGLSEPAAAPASAAPRKDPR